MSELTVKHRNFLQLLQVKCLKFTVVTVNSGILQYFVSSASSEIVLSKHVGKKYSEPLRPLSVIVCDVRVLKPLAIATKS